MGTKDRDLRGLKKAFVALVIFVAFVPECRGDSWLMQ
jgi:hypothetical protein